MFAPQTNPASPAVLVSKKPEEFYSVDSGDVLPAPHPLFPVYRASFATGENQISSRLGCCSSRLGWVSDHSSFNIKPSLKDGVSTQEF
jgi:hypothetical protein